MLRSMRTGVIAVASLFALVGTAHAEELSITKESPFAGLPAVSTDGSWYARPVRVQPSGCAGMRSYVEVGAVAAPGKETKGTFYLVRDECNAKAPIDKHIEQVNATLRGKAFRATGMIQVRAVPAQFDTAEGLVKVAAGVKNRVSVAIGKSQVDTWLVELDGPLIEVRGWYSSKNAAGAPYVSVLVAGAANDTGKRGRERWVDLWPTGRSGEDGGSSLVTIGERFMEALRTQNEAELSALLSAPFWKVGLTPASGKLAVECRKLQKVRSERALVRVAGCMAAAGTTYTKLPAKDTVAEIDMSEFPDELKRYRKRVRQLVRSEHKLVRYHVNENGYYVHVVLALDPETNYQTVSAVLESVDKE